MIAFWILAPIMVLAALGILFVRKAVHAALLLAVVMICLAVLYAVQDAPFLFAVQIIVYTGAILMLFLFVLMLVGVDASDSLVETIRGQRLLAAVVGLLFGADRSCSGSPRSAVGAVTGPRRGQRGRQRAGPRAAAVHASTSSRSRSTSALLITAAHRRDGARAPRAAHPEADAARPRRAADARLRRAAASTPARCRRPASSPGTTPSTPRPCCRTARRRRSRCPGCCSARGTVRAVRLDRRLDDDDIERTCADRDGPRATRASPTRKEDAMSADTVPRAVRDPVHDRLRRRAHPPQRASSCSCASS